MTNFSVASFREKRRDEHQLGDNGNDVQSVSLSYSLASKNCSFVLIRRNLSFRCRASPKWTLIVHCKSNWFPSELVNYSRNRLGKYTSMMWRKVTFSPSIGLLLKQRKRNKRCFFFLLSSSSRRSLMSHRSLSNSFRRLQVPPTSHGFDANGQSDRSVCRLRVLCGSDDLTNASSFRYRHELFNHGFGVEWMDESEEEPTRTITEESNNEQESLSDTTQQSTSKSSRSSIAVRSVYQNNTRLPAHIWRSLAKVSSRLLKYSFTRYSLS